jgi:hypothetical protein
MVTNIHITRILEKTPTSDLPYEVETFKNEGHDVIDCPDYYPAQNLSLSLASFLTSQRVDSHTSQNNERKYPIRVFTIQPEA